MKKLLLLLLCAMCYRVCCGLYLLSGFLPRETAQHHRGCILSLIQEALKESNIKVDDIDVICFTKGCVCFYFYTII